MINENYTSQLLKPRAFCPGKSAGNDPNFTTNLGLQIRFRINTVTSWIEVFNWVSKVTLCLVFTLIRSLNGSNRHFLNHRGKTKINRSFQNFLFVIGLLLLWFWRYDTHFKTALYCLVCHSTGKSVNLRAERKLIELHGFCVKPEKRVTTGHKNLFSEYRD